MLTAGQDVSMNEAAARPGQRSDATIDIQYDRRRRWGP